MELDLQKIHFKDVIEHQKEFKEKEIQKKVTDYDFKIVGFRLGEEYFGIDIMNIKEIKKILAKDITWVPNTLNFVKGVFNLRGEIISIIDLSVMFNLVESRSFKKEDVLSLLVIKLGDLKLGLIVDEIERVFPLRKAEIQPPSPLLGSINERFIKGVVELNNKLYVIFDTDEIFSGKTTSKKEVLQHGPSISEDYFIHFCNQLEELNAIHINNFNKPAFKNFFIQYMEENNIKELPTLDKQTAKTTVDKFISKHTSMFWGKQYAERFKEMVRDELSKICADEVRILVLGCGMGYEAFSVYFIIDSIFEDIPIRMVAADSNLSAITKASGLECDISEIPDWIKVEKYFFNVRDSLYKIKKEINDNILFEFHDARNIATYAKKFDLIVARDFSLYFSNEEYENFIKDVADRLVENALLVIGDNELIPKFDLFEKLPGELTIYKKIKEKRS